MTALIITASYAATFTSGWWSPFEPTVAMLGVELLTLTAVCWLVVSSAKRWLLFVAGFELLLVLCRFAVWLGDSSILLITYLDALAGLSYAILTALASGVYGTWRDRRRPARLLSGEWSA